MTTRTRVCTPPHSPFALHPSPFPARRGAVMVITLIAIILLAGMVFYIINLGRQANARIVAQHAADATAAAGAGWIARTFNTVAMNNVSTARMIATVSVLDAMPMAIAFTFEDQLAAYDALNEQLSRGVTDVWVRDAFLTLRDELRIELDILSPLNDFFNGQFDVTTMTYYDSPNGRGSLWRAMQAMDTFSQVSMENVGVLAQVHAINGGMVNLERDAHTPEQADAMMVPFVPQFAWKRGGFDDFERPVRVGLLPGDVDDKTTNRGPFDTIFGWRYGRAREMEGYYRPGSPGSPDNIVGDPRPHIPFGSSPGSGGGGGGWVVTSVTWENYGVHGPLQWMYARLSDFARDNLFHSRFARRVRELSDIKMSYCWPGDGIKTTIDPEWVIDLNEAAAIAASGEKTIHTTAFFRCEIKSVIKRGSGGFLSPGTWAYIYGLDSPANRYPATIIHRGGWIDPRTWAAFPGVSKPDSHIWRDEWEYQAYSDVDLNLMPRFDAQGNPVPYTIYRIDSYAFLGVDVGEPVDVLNPYNYSSKQDLPAPIDFDHTQVKSDEVSRREKLTYLAAAQRSNRSMFWPSRFDADKPYPYTVGLAQVSVFNNHSWDLWTQMWHAQIERITDYDDWVARLSDFAADSDQVPQLDATQVDNLFSYLKSIQPLADVMLMH